VSCRTQAMAATMAGSDVQEDVAAAARSRDDDPSLLADCAEAVAFGGLPHVLQHGQRKGFVEEHCRGEASWDCGAEVVVSVGDREVELSVLELG
jgi:hypothetical protein